MSNYKFGTAINCRDGRVQQPVFDWMKKNYCLDYVDMITEPGPDKVLSEGPSEIIESTRAKVAISVNAHGSKIIAIAGHYDCAANPVSKEEHWVQIQNSIQVIQNWGLPVTVIGLWVGDNWEVKLLSS